MVPFLYHDLMKVVKKNHATYFQAWCCESLYNYICNNEIYFDNKDNFLKVKDMFLGFATEKCISDLQKKDLTSKHQIAKFCNSSAEIKPQ